ncbi:hypothetical protein [Haloarcula onubensis]|uniref:Secreted protein n=1 Tax=Haloarcula onubensis TaxID=2950539 RepID=A0ABU2FUM8_9EURY|nr:hypothetical protein [Halomicroarcula sp. S3CR25-11]MDS0283946.1 hypothetical protein [Halomicroarcula sp. S3CR25-11]
MKRRSMLGSVAVAIPLSGCSLNRSESGNIQIANQTNQEVWKEIAVQRNGGLFSESGTVYETRTRTPPTERYRGTLTDVAPPGTYEVQVEFEAVETDQDSGVHTTQWSPSGEESESLIITLTPDFDVEFLTQ